MSQPLHKTSGWQIKFDGYIANKDRCAVVIPTKIYKTKQRNELLADSTIYERLSKDPTPKYVTKLTNPLKKFKDAGKITYAQ